ncbi:MAG TPA: type II secretion system F family protein [Vicinamibacteria bacterium]|nr:type II secretion system F family protein [Vicinamibacteria bacterium]
MSQFVAKVGTSAGDIEEHAFTAVSEVALRGELSERGYHVFWIRRSLGVPSLRALLRRGRQRITQTEFTLFNQELAALLRAGLPLVQSLDIMLERMKNPFFRQVLQDVRDKVKSGTALSDAFRSHGALFPSIYSASLMAGEKSGGLEEVIQRYVKYLKLTEGTKKKVVAALVYPCFLFVSLIFAAAFLLLWVVPRFAGFFEGFDADLPLLTRVLLGIANTLRAHIVIILLVLVGGGCFFYVWSKREGSKRVIDRMTLRLPFLGHVLHVFATSQLTRSLGTLLSGGIPLVQAIDIAASSIGNRHVGAAVRPVAARVREGKAFSSSLEETNEFSNLTIEMVKVGENTGGLAEMLHSVADFADEEIDNRLTLLLSMLAPVVLLLMGGLVAVILLSIYLPMFDLINAARQGF